MSDKSDTPRTDAEENVRVLFEECQRLKRELAQARASLNEHLESEAAETMRADRERARAEKAEAEREALRGFVAAVFEESGWPNGGDIDGFAFQDAAIAAGLLTGETRTVPCGESCHCAEYHGDISEGVTCYRKAPWLLAAAINAARAK